MSDQPSVSSARPPLDNDQLQQLLSSLLHAERAGVRVCLYSRAQAPGARQQQLLQDIQRDEAKSCLGLINSLQMLGCVPDKVIGEFAQQCMAIENFDDRLRFLNRGQGWVAKQIRAALPRIEQAEIRQQLAEMLEDHQRNLDKINALLGQSAPKPANKH